MDLRENQAQEDLQDHLAHEEVEENKEVKALRVLQEELGHQGREVHKESEVPQGQLEPQVE